VFGYKINDVLVETDR